MPDGPMISYAQNAEDVVLWRALADVPEGIYVDVGGYDPDEDSVTRIFYEHGWRGIDVEPVPELAERFRRRRPGNEIVEAAVTDQDLHEVVLHSFDSTGLSTLDGTFAARHDQAGFEHRQIHVPVVRLDDVLARSSLVTDTIHFLKVDVEGAEDQVLRSLDLATWRPWVLVIEATEPNSTTPTHLAWEPMLIDAGYIFTLFDGLSRFYVSREHVELLPVLSYPACVFDFYTTARHAEAERRLLEIDAAMGEQVRARQADHETATRWRNLAATYWAEAVAAVQASESATGEALFDAERTTLKHTEMRKTLQRVRAERNLLRDRVRRLRLRVDTLSNRVVELDNELRNPHLGARRVLGRARRDLARFRARVQTRSPQV